MTGEKVKKCLWLFWINLFIGAFTFGGGYIVVPMISKYYVRKKHLFSKEELLSMAAIAQSTPGAIAVNLSALAGHRTAGLPGVLASCLGAVIPPLVLLSAVASWYEAFSSSTAVEAVLRGMQAGVAALIVDIVVDMWRMILRKKSALLHAMVQGFLEERARIVQCDGGRGGGRSVRHRRRQAAQMADSSSGSCATGVARPRSVSARSTLPSSSSASSSSRPRSWARALARSTSSISMNRSGSS